MCMNGTCGQPTCTPCIQSERHANQIDHRCCEIAKILMRRGKSDEYAYRVAARFVEKEFKSLIEWG